MVRHLTMLQIDPVAAIAPSAYVVAWSRLGSPCSPGRLDSKGTLDLFEFDYQLEMYKPVAKRR